MKHLATLSVCVVLGLCASHVSSADPAPGGDRAGLRAQLLEQRKLNLKRFHAYRLARVYPHNSYEEGKLNVWTDSDGHLCAVATLMHDAGLDGVVTQTAKDNNFVRVADQTSGPLIDWVLTSGFTQEEIVMIQQPSEADIEMMDREYRREQRKLARKLQREDDRLETNYVAIEKALKRRVMTDAGLDLAVARLESRPELASALLAKH